MQRRLFTALAALSLVMCVAMGVMWVRSYEAWASVAPSTAWMQGRLAGPIPTLSFNKVTVRDAVAFWAEISGVKVKVDWGALEAAHVDPTALVVGNFNNTRVGGVLVDIIAVSGGLEYVSEGDAVHIVIKGVKREYAPDPAGQTSIQGPARKSPSALPPPPSPLREVILGSRRWTVTSHRGILRLWSTPADPASEYQKGVPVGNGTGPDANKVFDVAGFFLRQGASPFNSWVVGTPYWGLMVIVGVVPLLWVRSVVRYLRRKTEGCCAVCGYDLRASKERCPECGTPITREGSVMGKG